MVRMAHMVDIRARVDASLDGQPAWIGTISGAAAMVFVGGSVAVSSLLGGAPMFTTQSIRYAIACALLLVLARVSGRKLTMPHRDEWLWLFGVTVTGLVLFNVALVRGGQHAEPAVFGVAVACVPVLLAVVGPLVEGRRPKRSTLIAALIVTLGAGLVEGLGRSDGVGLMWAVVVFACEAGFTLLALPVLPGQGPWGVSVHSTWLAAVIFGVLGLVREGPTAVIRLTGGDLVAIGYLAVAVTAIAFLLWYFSVGRLGAGRAGLLTGVAPAAAAAIGVAVGRPLPGPLVWVGIAVVALGLVLGLSGGRRPAT